MEGTPEYLDYTEIMETFLSISGVVRVHNLRIWVSMKSRQSLSDDNYAATTLRFVLLSSTGSERQQNRTCSSSCSWYVALNRDMKVPCELLLLKAAD